MKIMFEIQIIIVKAYTNQIVITMSKSTSRGKSEATASKYLGGRWDPNITVLALTPAQRILLFKISIRILISINFNKYCIFKCNTRLSAIFTYNILTSFWTSWIIRIIYISNFCFDFR